MARAWLSLGANLGDAPANLAEAVRRIGEADGVAVVAQSGMITTKPWGKTDQPDFLNLALEINTALEPVPLLDALQAIEAVMGRERLEHWGPRLIDIDVVAYERLEMDTARLTLPHRYAHERDFVLDPLREIAPEVAQWLTSRRS
ncbi:MULTISPECIES: 2-amino-4-hydroxy-6-hydroxymethyldihydropteridine diphosphokinase [unclassified Devosia]|uniref:2-amino-4-hydroxy-6- hydroxymethyldihydropteridine diphosphokinase n=1 Tax=unclassified Devosia TaxID=196773 RepID=UPI001556B22F|nr:MULTISPECIES: 2-amino-4-hydroxy-6-hydroxymethyldihydropteridine diphosphokinase [unclassified Devosia]